MTITIEFSSIWQNSFLEEINTNKRKFIATSKARNLDLYRGITKNTILGVLSRLIGDQRPLQMAKESEYFYFRDIENFISEPSMIDFESYNENVILINKSETRPSQGTFLGTLPNKVSLFDNEYSSRLWSILKIDFSELLEFILDKKSLNKNNLSKPLEIITEVEKLKARESIELLKSFKINLEEKINKESDKKKPNAKNLEELNRQLIEIKSDGKQAFYKLLEEVIKKLKEIYPDVEYVINDKIYPLSLYCAGLYIQAERMEKENIDTSFCFNERGLIQGFSKKGFNGVRDFLNKFAGNRKRTSKTPVNITKANGILEIILNIPRDKAKELKQLIENAGVSSFYLGKKGLAYVTNIDTREVS